MNEIPKARFKELYFQYSLEEAERCQLGPKGADWEAVQQARIERQWEDQYEQENRPKRFLVAEPESPRHRCMFVVTDFASGEHRMFFRTEEDADGVLEWPDAD